MILLAISGGPDSMFLLNQYRNKKVVVAHVNYHKRVDSDIDENIVKNFCAKFNIPFEVLNVKEKPEGNFQAWARGVRYNFFKEIYEKYQCKKVLMAHHKDDFIETALMQQRSGRNPRFFGIKETNEINGMQIERPLIKYYFKSELVAYLEKNNIDFAIDSSNAEPIFERNKIRLELLEKTMKEKQDLYEWFVLANKILKKKFAHVDFLFSGWKKREFNLNYFREMPKLQEEVVFELIHNQFNDIKLSSNKIEGIIQYLNSLEGNKEFKLDENNSLYKNKGKLEFIKSN